MWEGIIPWVPSDPPLRKEVLFRVSLFDKDTGTTRPIILAASFTNTGDQLLGFFEVDDQRLVSAVGL